MLAGIVCKGLGNGAKVISGQRVRNAQHTGVRKSQAVEHDG